MRMRRCITRTCCMDGILLYAHRQVCGFNTMQNYNETCGNHGSFAVVPGETFAPWRVRHRRRKDESRGMAGVCMHAQCAYAFSKLLHPVVCTVRVCMEDFKYRFAIYTDQNVLVLNCLWGALFPENKTEYNWLGIICSNVNDMLNIC